MELFIYLAARAIYFSNPELMAKSQEEQNKKLKRLEADLKRLDLAFETYRDMVLKNIGEEAEKCLYEGANEEYSLKDLYEVLGIPPE